MGDTQNVIPLLIYDDIAAVQDFLARAFGFERGILQRDPDGRVVHGEVWADGRVIWLHCATVEHGLASPKERAAVSSGVVVLVADVDAHVRRAREAGAAIEREPCRPVVRAARVLGPRPRRRPVVFRHAHRAASLI